MKYASIYLISCGNLKAFAPQLSQARALTLSMRLCVNERN